MDQLLNRKRFHLEVWELLFRVIEEQSLARVADQRGLDRTQVSRLIKALESDVGHELLIRNGPTIAPTQFAMQAKNKLQPIWEEFNQSLLSLSTTGEQDSGIIRFGARPGFMQSQILPILGEFQQKYPHITFDIISDDDPRTYMRGQTDVMFYYGPVNNPNLIENWVSRSVFIPCASPEYVKNHGMPKTPEDLRSHFGIVYTGRHRHQEKVLELAGDRRTYEWHSTLRVNSMKAVKEAALAGAGIIADIPMHHCYKELMSGELIPVLNGWHAPNLDYYIASTLEATKLKRVQIFIEWYVQKRREIETERKRILQQQYNVPI